MASWLTLSSPPDGRRCWPAREVLEESDNSPRLKPGASQCVRGSTSCPVPQRRCPRPYDGLRGSHVMVFDQAAARAAMRSHAQALLHVLPAAVAVLRREARGDSNDSMTSSFSLLFEDSKKRAPTRVVKA